MPSPQLGTVLVTGAASGLGAATVAAVREAGGRPLALDRVPVDGVPHEVVDLSDTRAATRRHFRVDGPSTAYAALRRLAALGEVDADAPKRAFEMWKIDDPRAGTSGSAGGDA